MAAPARQSRPVTAKKTVSVATMFKRPMHRTKEIDVTPHARRGQDKGVVVNASATKSGSGLRSPHKVEKKLARRRSEIHPIVAAFKETSEDYRRQLYKTTSQTINKTLEALLHTLYESTLQPVSSCSINQDPKASPLRLTAPVKYERMAMKLYQPLSHYKLSLYSTNPQGERQRFESTLANRMEDYKSYIAKCTEEVAQLQKQWEMIVGEIWKLGTACLGQETMKPLLVTQDESQLLLDFPPTSPKAESTLFVPEHSSPMPPRDGNRSGKRVTFETPRELPPTTRYPAFLDQPSRYPKDTLAVALPLPAQEVCRLAEEVEQLGKRQMAELRKIDKERQQFWKRKTKLIMQSLAEE